MFRAAYLLTPLIVTGALLGQQSPLTGPVEGFVFDAPTRSIRTVLGSLGSATLGPALLEGVEYGSVAPHRNHAVAFRDGQCLIVSGLGSEQVATATLFDALQVPDGAAWSGDGAVAVFFSRANNWIQVVKGLPGSPRLEPSLDVSFLGGRLSAVVADSRGAQIVIGIVSGDSGVYRLADGGSPEFLLAVSNPIGLAFSSEGEGVYVLDGAARRISVLNLVNLTTESWAVDVLEEPIAIGSTKDSAGRLVVYVVGRKDRSLLVFDAVTHEWTATLELSSAPTGLEPLGRGSFLLGSRATNAEPIWSVVTGPQPALFFIPAPPPLKREEQ
jgi:hypothetical protein